MKMHKKLAQLKAQMEEEQQKQPVVEAVLPLELLAAVLFHAPPEDLAAACAVCKHFQMATKLAVDDRGRGLGLLPCIVAKLTARKLNVLEAHAAAAAVHIRSLEAGASRQALQRVSVDILRVHFDALIARVDALVAQGAHAPEAPRVRVRELEEMLELLKRLDCDLLYLQLGDGKDGSGKANVALFAQPRVIKTLLALLAGSPPCNSRAVELLHRLSWSAPESIVQADTASMSAFRVAMNNSSSRNSMLFPMDVLRVLERLPTRALAPLRDELEHVGKDKYADRFGASEHERKKACELLIAMDMDTGRSGYSIN